MPAKYSPIPELDGNPNEPVLLEELNEIIQAINERLLDLSRSAVGVGQTIEVLEPDVAGVKNFHLLGSGSLFNFASVAAITLGGLTGGIDGRVVAIRNNGAVTITLYQEFTGAPAEYRFSLRTGTTFDITAGSQLSLLYDGRTQRWVPIATGP